MKNIFRLALSLTALLVVAACASRVPVSTSTRMYEEADTAKINNAVSKTFTKLGYDTLNAKLEKNTGTTDSEKTKTITYSYGPAKFPGSSDRNCMKVATASVSTNPGKPIHIVHLQSAAARCYSAIGKMHIEVDTDEKTYNDFFDTLSKQLGKQGTPIGSPR